MFPGEDLYIGSLLSKGISIEKVGLLLKDLWQCEFQYKLMNIINQLISNPNLHVERILDEGRELLNRFIWISKSFSLAYSISDEFSKIYNFMKIQFKMLVEAMEELYDVRNRIPFSLHLEGKFIISEYVFKRTWILIHIGICSRTVLHNTYIQARNDFMQKINSFNFKTRKIINDLAFEHKQSLNLVDNLFESTLIDDEEDEIVDYFSRH